MRLPYLTALLVWACWSCSKEDLALNGQSVKAQVLYRSCAGTTLQWIETPTSKGQDWQWTTDPTAPASQTNPIKVYPNCVSAFDIPMEKQVVGDTLEFSYQEIKSPSGNVCSLGGLPTLYISVKHLKS